MQGPDGWGGSSGCGPTALARIERSSIECGRQLRGWGTAWTTWHEAVKTQVAPDDVVALLDRCSNALDAGDGPTFIDCHAPEAAIHISADGVRGAWTEEYRGSAAIRTWLDVTSAYGRITRTGDVTMIGDLVAYPFQASSSDACRAGIDVLRLDPAHARILSHWAFCGG